MIIIIIIIIVITKQDCHDNYRKIITVLIFIILFDDWQICFCLNASGRNQSVDFHRRFYVWVLFGAWYWKEFSYNLWLFNCYLNSSFMSLFDRTFIMVIFYTWVAILSLIKCVLNYSFSKIAVNPVQYRGTVGVFNNRKFINRLQ